MIICAAAHRPAVHGSQHMNPNVSLYLFLTVQSYADVPSSLRNHIQLRSPSSTLGGIMLTFVDMFTPPSVSQLLGKTQNR